MDRYAEYGARLEKVNTGYTDEQLDQQHLLRSLAAPTGLNLVGRRVAWAARDVAGKMGATAG